MKSEAAPELSLVITTYGGESAHTQACLSSIRRWKKPAHEVVVVVHDESPTLRVFLELCCRLGIVDRLVLAEPGHGHVRGVNLGFELARAELVFNVCIDMRIGGNLVADCVRLLEAPSTGMVGWHYDWSVDCEGNRWQGNKLAISLRRPDVAMPKGRLLEEHVQNIRSAPWFTGKVLDGVGDLRITCCNGSFFGIRRALWQRLGGFDERLYPVHFGDDFLTYAVLDQGLDVLNIPRRYRCGGDPAEFTALTDLGWLKRHDPFRGVDRVDWRTTSSDARLGTLEKGFLEMLERSLKTSSRVLVLGEPPWRPKLASTDADGAELIVCAAGRYTPGLEQRLAPGGLLVTFDGDEAPASATCVGSLATYRAPEERLRFVRRSGDDLRSVV